MLRHHVSNPLPSSINSECLKLLSPSGGYIDLIVLTCLFFFLRGGGPSLPPGAIAGTQREVVISNGIRNFDYSNEFDDPKL